MVSAAPLEIVEPLADHLGIDKFIATTPVVDSEGRYTGEVEFYAYGNAKAEAIKEMAENLSLDLNNSWAYSDSATDLPMLEVVGNPVAVNPDRELSQQAEQRGWPILEFTHKVPLGDRIPIKRNWVIATVLTVLMGMAITALIRRFNRQPE